MGLMKILRLAWSRYHGSESLGNEQRYLENQGHCYRRAGSNGVVPDELPEYEVLIINSQYTVDEPFLRLWEAGLIVTASNGYDHIDLETAESLGIPVARTPRARAGSVVRHTTGFIMALLRDLHRTGTRLRNGQWCRSRAHNNIRQARDLTFGVLGYGLIGRRIARRALGMNFRDVLVHDPFEAPNGNESGGIQFLEWVKFLEAVDFLTLHADLNSTTHGLVDEAVLRRLGKDGYLVNTARGSMVNLDDLFEALDRGRLAGAALDVFPEEPPRKNHDLNRNGLLTTPHSAGFHPDLLDDLKEEIGTVIRSYESGSQLKHELKPRTK